jgi:predicted transcriptional regulator
MKPAMSVRVEEDIKERLHRLAEKEKRTPHAMMTEAIVEYVDRREKMDRFAMEAQVSLKHYKETGLHITMEELSAWLDTVGTDAQTEFPKCHT